LSIVAIVLLVFLIRNPVLSRQTQQQLVAVKDLILENPQRFIRNQSLLQDISQTNSIRVLVFNANRETVIDTNPEKPQIQYPRRNLLDRGSQTAIDSEGNAWLYTFSRLQNGQILVVTAPRPRVRVLNIFADEFFPPILEAGVIASMVSLILAFALSRWVADPLQQVIVAAKKYPQGSDDINPIAPQGPREVQGLTRAFNSMVARVHASQKSQRDFVANVSHELKTPLTSIQGFSQAILDDTANTPEARKQAAQIIYDEAGRMHRMALDLLELARLEAGTADLEMSNVDVKALLQSVVEKFTPQAQKAGVHIQVDVSNDFPMVIGDGDRLAQVFVNLVDNALKFTPSNGKIALSAKKAGAEMELSITDTGSGIPNEALPRLFDRFYQADPSRAGGETAAGRRGAGLGLAIVKEIVEVHGGKIGVRSQVGRGTTFTIHLPLARK
jgi:signal transduction histidine kinase